MAEPLITVLITTYNYGLFIEAAIDSVLSERFPLDRVEIVVVDDGSTDDTTQRLKRYESRIRYFYQSNGGQAAALNAGFANARGEIVMLLDADDLFMPGRLARIAKVFEENPHLGMAYHRMLEWNMETGERRESSFPMVSGDTKTVPELFLQYVPQATSCISFRRTALSRLLPIPNHIRMLADGFLVDLIPFLSPIVAVPEVLAVYRIHKSNHYYYDERLIPPEVRKDRLRTRKILVEAMNKWLVDNGYSRAQLPVRLFHDVWSLYLQSEEFLIKAPGRLRFFWWLAKKNRLGGTKQTWKLSVSNYLASLFALLFGYAKADRIYEWRDGTTRTLGKVSRMFGGRSNRSSNG